MTTPLLDRKTMADRLNIKVATFRQRVECRPDFPKPALRLSRKTVRWEAADFEQWLHRHRAMTKR